jgi:hypothetical protein
MHRHGIQSPGQRVREDSWSRRIGPVGMEEEIELHRTAVKQGEGVRMVGDHVNGYTQYVKLEGWQVLAWDTPASTGVSVSCRTLSPTRKWTSFSMPSHSASSNRVACSNRPSASGPNGATGSATRPAPPSTPSVEPMCQASGKWARRSIRPRRRPRMPLPKRQAAPRRCAGRGCRA